MLVDFLTTLERYKQGQKFIGIVYLGDPQSRDKKGLKLDLEYVDAIIGRHFHQFTIPVWNKTTDAQNEPRNIVNERRIWEEYFNPSTMEPARNPTTPITRDQVPPCQGRPGQIVHRFLAQDLDDVQVILRLQQERTTGNPLTWGETKVFKVWKSHQGWRGKVKRFALSFAMN